MAAAASKSRRYKPTEAKFKGGAAECYVTYDLPQANRSKQVLMPKVKRVYVAGKILKWSGARKMQKRSGKVVRGLRVVYAQSRSSYDRRGFAAKRGATRFAVSPAHVGRAKEQFSQVVEVPEKARNVKFHATASSLPEKYRHALQRVR